MGTEVSPRTQATPHLLPSRRSVVKGATWSVPLVAAAISAPAFAASSPVADGCYPAGTLFDSQARARMLSGAIGGADLDGALELEGAYATASGTAVSDTDSAGLSITALSALSLNFTGLTGVVSSILEFTTDQDAGVLNQFAYAHEAAVGTDTAEIGGAGAVNQATGAITLDEGEQGPPALGSIDLYTLLNTLTANPAVADLLTDITDLSLDVGAVAGRAEVDSLCTVPANDELLRDYLISYLRLIVDSPVAGGVLTSLTEGLDRADISLSTSALLDALRPIPFLGPLLAGVGGALASVDSTVTINTAQLTDAPIPNDPNAAVQLDLGASRITLNLETLLDGGLNDQPANTRLFIDAGIADGSVQELIDSLLDTILERVTELVAVDVRITVAGLVRVRVQGTLADLLNGSGSAAVESWNLLGGGWVTLAGVDLALVLAAVGGVVEDALAALFNTGGVLAGALDGVDALLDVLFTVLQEVLRITVNAQNKASGTVPSYYQGITEEGRYDVAALHLEAVGLLNLLNLSVGRGSVGANTAR